MHKSRSYTHTHKKKLFSEIDKTKQQPYKRIYYTYINMFIWGHYEFMQCNKKTNFNQVQRSKRIQELKRKKILNHISFLKYKSWEIFRINASNLKQKKVLPLLSPFSLNLDPFLDPCNPLSLSHSLAERRIDDVKFFTDLHDKTKKAPFCSVIKYSMFPLWSKIDRIDHCSIACHWNDLSKFVDSHYDFCYGIWERRMFSDFFLREPFHHTGHPNIVYIAEFISSQLFWESTTNTFISHAIAIRR